MRRIKDNAQLRKLIEAFYVDTFRRRDPAQFILPLARLAALKSRHRTDTLAKPARRKKYIEYIEANYERILTADVATMKRLILECAEILPTESISKEFAKEVKEAMGYEDMRDLEFPYFFSQLGIRTCMYCHSQLTLTIIKDYYVRNHGVNKIGDVKTRKAILELDHKYPASKYPFLSTSLYNLLPVCGNCNKTKHNKTIDLEFFTAGEKLDIFSFSIEPQSLIDYELSKDREVLKVLFTHLEGDTALEKKYNDLFDVKEIYNMQQDILEELLLKKQIYNKPYVQALAERFDKLFPDQLSIDRLVIGTFTDAEQVHKRPMAKFIQDIAIDIGLLPKKPK